MYTPVVVNPTVNVMAATTPTVGSSVTLVCFGTIVRGANKRLDIVWSRDINNQIQSTIGVAVSPTSNSMLAFTNSYTTDVLNENDNGTLYECEVILDGTAVNVGINFTLNLVCKLL